MRYTIEATVYYQRPADEGDGFLIRAEGKHATDEHGGLTFPDLQLFWAGTATPPQTGEKIRITVDWPSGLPLIKRETGVNYPQTVDVQPANERDQANG